MNTTLKAVLLGIYLLAAASTKLGTLAAIAPTVQWLALVLFAAHALELLFAFGAVKRHPGPLVDSIALTMLFGLLHWKPLAKKP